AAASAALQRWEFSAARAGDRAVADFLVVRVPVKGSPALPERTVEDAPAPVPTGTTGDGQPAGTARDGEPSPGRFPSRIRARFLEPMFRPESTHTTFSPYRL